MKKGRRELSVQQSLFVEHYLVTMNGAEAVRLAGYKTKNPRNTASELLSNPRIQEAIAAGMEARVARLHIDQNYVLLKLAEIVDANVGDYMDFHGQSVSLRNMSELPREKLGLIKDVVQTENGVRITLPDKLAALDKLARHVGMFERHRQSRKRPDDITREVLEQLLQKSITPVEAALRLDAEGLPLPESVRLLLAKVEPEPQSTDDGAYATISPEEMALRAKQRREEVEGQQTFVRQRKEEVDALKAEMGGGAFQPQEDDNGQKRP